MRSFASHRKSHYILVSFVLRRRDNKLRLIKIFLSFSRLFLRDKRYQVAFLNELLSFLLYARIFSMLVCGLYPTRIRTTKSIDNGLCVALIFNKEHKKQAKTNNVSLLRILLREEPLHSLVFEGCDISCWFFKRNGSSYAQLRKNTSIQKPTSEEEIHSLYLL